MKINHNTFGILTVLATFVLYFISVKTQNEDLAIVCKMNANVACMLSVVLLFARFIVSKDNSHDPWPFIMRDPIAIALVISGLAIGTGLCTLGTLSLFG